MLSVLIYLVVPHNFNLTSQMTYTKIKQNLETAVGIGNTNKIFKNMKLTTRSFLAHSAYVRGIQYKHHLLKKISKLSR